MRRRGHATVLLGCLLGAALVAVPSGAADDAVPVAGTLRIDADGIGGLVLDLPRTVDVTDLRLTPGADTSFAFVGFAPSLRSPQNCAPDEIDFLCLGHTIWYVREDGEPGVFASPVMLAGYVDVYIVADGPVHLEVDFPGFEGTSDVRADRHIDASFARLTPTCMTPMCNVVYGGESRYVEHGFAASLAFSVPPEEFLVSRGWANRNSTCIYPDPFWAPNTPPHREGRQGCDSLNLDDWADTENQTYAWIFPGTLEIRANNGAHGEIYTGFRAADFDPRAAHPLAGAASALGGYGIWFEQGVE